MIDARRATQITVNPYAADVPTTARFAIDGPYQAGPMYRFLAKHAVYGVEVADETATGWRYSRTLNLPGGQAVVSIDWDSTEFNAAATAEEPEDEALALNGARRLLDLTADTARIDTVLATGPIAPLVARTPGLRVPGAFDVSEVLFRTLIGQQISVAGARRIGATVTERFGSPLHLKADPRLTHVFPSPAQLATAEAEDLPMPRSRGRALAAAAASLRDREVRLDREHARADVLALHGIGPWTADYLMMRAFGDHDIFLSTDLVLRKVTTSLGMPEKIKDLNKAAEIWAPYRSYASMHLWIASGVL